MKLNAQERINKKITKSSSESEISSRSSNEENSRVSREENRLEDTAETWPV